MSKSSAAKATPRGVAYITNPSSGVTVAVAFVTRVVIEDSSFDKVARFNLVAYIGDATDRVRHGAQVLATVYSRERAQELHAEITSFLAEPDGTLELENDTLPAPT